MGRTSQTARCASWKPWPMWPASPGPIIRSAPARSSRLSRLSVSRKRSWGVLVTACPFCERILLRHYNHLWTEGDEGIVSFEPLDPVTPGHRLVVPVRHIPDAVADPILAGKVM